MSKQNIGQFIGFLLNNKNLTREQRFKVSKLLVRDAILVKEKASAQSKEETSDMKINTEISDSKAVYRFLRQFSMRDALKYTTHSWDKDPNSDNGMFESFETFKNEYISVLNQRTEKTPNLADIYNLCPDLWSLIKNFLVQDDSILHWSEYKLKIGYNKHVKQWLDSNKGKQPFDMPISEFPSDVQPDLIEDRTLSSFKDVVDIFKRQIEFRDNDFYRLVRSVFRNQQFELDESSLDSLKGVSFYTFTPNVKIALLIIANNIFFRKEYPQIKISYYTNDVADGKTISIEILQKGSFSYRELSDEKITAQNEDGDIAIIKKYLRNLCDFSVESIFKNQGMETAMRINYLVSEESSLSVQEIELQKCVGFKYVLTFPSFLMNDLN